MPRLSASVAAGVWRSASTHPWPATEKPRSQQAALKGPEDLQLGDKDRSRGWPTFGSRRKIRISQANNSDCSSYSLRLCLALFMSHGLCLTVLVLPKAWGRTFHCPTFWWEQAPAGHSLVHSMAQVWPWIIWILNQSSSPPHSHLTPLTMSQPLKLAGRRPSLTLLPACKNTRGWNRPMISSLKLYCCPFIYISLLSWDFINLEYCRY